MFSRSHYAISDLFPRVILERSFNHKRKVEFYNAAQKHLRKMESEMRGRSLRQDEKFAFQIAKSFSN